MKLGGNQTRMAEGLRGAVEDPRRVGGCHPDGEGGSIERGEVYMIFLMFKVIVKSININVFVMFNLVD